MILSHLPLAIMKQTIPFLALHKQNKAMYFGFTSIQGTDGNLANTKNKTAMEKSMTKSEIE